MRSLPDLHPDDRAARLALRDTLVARRVDLGLSQLLLADRLGVKQGTISTLERGDSWQIGTVQWWARPLGLRLVAGVLDAPTDDTVDLLRMMRPADPDRADAWDRAALVEQLIATRVAAGLTQQDIGGRLGVSDQSVSRTECCAGAGLLVLTAQRHCRALGTVLRVELEPAPVEARAAA